MHSAHAVSVTSAVLLHPGSGAKGCEDRVTMIELAGINSLGA